MLKPRNLLLLLALVILAIIVLVLYITRAQSETNTNSSNISDELKEWCPINPAMKAPCVQAKENPNPRFYQEVELNSPIER